METNQITQIVLNALDLANQSRPDNQQIPVNATTIIFGNEGHLDSMGLVTLLMDIEDALQDDDINISLSDERAMSQARSPFKDVPSLVIYIQSLLSEE
jgi:acyl carrier protein